MNDGPDTPLDEIAADVRAARDALAAEHGYDVRRLFAALQRRERESDRPRRDPAPRPVARAASG